jgi:hypothetical protein
LSPYRQIKSPMHMSPRIGWLAGHVPASVDDPSFPAASERPESGLPPPLPAAASALAPPEPVEPPLPPAAPPAPADPPVAEPALPPEPTVPPDPPTADPAEPLDVAPRPAAPVLEPPDPVVPDPPDPDEPPLVPEVGIVEALSSPPQCAIAIAMNAIQGVMNHRRFMSPP